MNKKKILFSIVLVLFIIILNNTCFASTDFQIDFTGIDKEIVFVLDNSNGEFDDYAYCIITQDGSSYKAYLSESPFYNKSGSVASGYTMFTSDTDIIYYSQTEDGVYNLSFSDFWSVGGNYSDFTNGHAYINSNFYTDDTLSELYSGFGDIIYFDDAFYEFGESASFQGVVNSISNALALDNLFAIVEIAIPIIVLAVLFVLGYVLVRYVLRKINR